jgi:predicted transcriptional regulator
MTSKSSKKGTKHDGINQIVADMYGVTPTYVSMVRSGERNGPRTERILSAVMDLIEGKSKLIKEVERVVNLEEKPTRKRQAVKYGDLK